MRFMPVNTPPAVRIHRVTWRPATTRMGASVPAQSGRRSRMQSHNPAHARFPGEVRATATLALPLVLGHVSTGLIGFVDNVIAGHHSTQTLAAVTIGTALLWLPM